MSTAPARRAAAQGPVALRGGAEAICAAPWCTDNLFNERPFKLYLIVVGFPIVGLLVMGAIIGALGA